MVERHSPLAGVLKPGSFGASFAAGSGVTLSETPVAALTQIAGWGDFEDAALPVLKDLGFADVGDYRQCRSSGEMRLYRTAPDRVWIAAQSATKLPASMSGNSALAVLDLSHSRTRIAIEGPAAEDVLARLAPIDFRATALPVDDFVQTGIHHVGVLIHRISALCFNILVPVTWARSIWEFIGLNAAPFGYDVRLAA